VTFQLSTILEEKNALAVFGEGNAERLINDIRNEVLPIVCDVETAKGRKEIASLAHKVSRSKTALDSLGKNLVADWKAKSKAVDAERKYIRDSLDALRDEVRQPLTDWEDAERARAEREALEKEICEAHELALVENELFNRERELRLKEEAAALEAERKLEEERAKKQEQERIEREAQIAQEAAERARVNAEKKAEAEKAANKAHQKKVNNSVLVDLMALGADETLAKKIISSAAKGEIGFLTINY
jgi:hypothetical protein